MKSTIQKVAAGLFALSFAAPLAIAAPEDGKPEGERPARGERPQRGDRAEGERPSREEMEARRKEMMEKYDADKDGELSVDERVKMTKDRLKVNERFAEFFTRRADTNEDGELSDEEIRAAVEKMGQRRGGPRGERPGGPRGERPEGGPRGERPRRGDGPKEGGE